MSARANAQIDSKRPVDASSLSDEGIGEGARLKGGSPWRSLEIDTLRWRWQAAVSDSHTFPPFEELALDGLGGLADNVALLQMDETHEFQILRAGKVFECWIDRSAHNLKITELSVDRARALQDLLDRAVNERQPVQTAAHGVVDGSVCTYDLVALPLANRWGSPLLLVYMQEREQKFSLVEAMFQATTDGLVALAVLRDARGEPNDFRSPRLTMARPSSCGEPRNSFVGAVSRKYARLFQPAKRFRVSSPFSMPVAAPGLSSTAGVTPVARRTLASASRPSAISSP